MFTIVKTFLLRLFDDLRGVMPLKLGIDYNFITPSLGTGGGIATAQDVEKLINAGVTHIIDCRIEFDDNDLLVQNSRIMHYLWNPVSDNGLPKPPSWFKGSLDFAMPALKDHTCKVYAHCSAGVNRGPSTAYFLLRALGNSPAHAEQMIREARPQVGLRYKADADRAITILGLDICPRCRARDCGDCATCTCACHKKG